MRIQIELRPTRHRPAWTVSGRAAVVSAEGQVSVVLDDGVLCLLAVHDWRPGDGERWFTPDGERIRRPLVHGAPDEDVCLHIGSEVFAHARRRPWTVSSYDHIPELALIRHRDRPWLSLASTRHGRGWTKWTKSGDIEGHDTITLAAASFCRESLLVAAAAVTRSRLSPLAV